MGAPTLCALLSSACAPGPVRLASIPEELTVCDDEPQAPELPEQDWGATLAVAEAIQRVRDIATLGYVLSLRSAYGSCRADVDGAKAWNEETGN